MIRALHRWPGLLALVLACVLALSGAMLAVFPAAERLGSPQAATGMSVAELAERVQTQHPAVEQIRRAPSGRVTAYWFDGDQPISAVIDPATGDAIAPANPNPAERWLTSLHRSLFLGDGGRVAMAIGAAAMLMLAFSGAIMVARRTGGWRHWFSPLRGGLAGRLHVELARIAFPGLVFSAATALWMSASTFGFLPDAVATSDFPAEVSGLTGAPLAEIEALSTTPVSELQSLSFPYAGDARDVFTLKTESGTGYLDQGTGATLAWADTGFWQQASGTIRMLHTGQGAAIVGLVLGLMALAVPGLAVTGLVIWFAGWRASPRIRGNMAAASADTIILVGSENGSTWGFAATLHAALGRIGQKVHVAAMSDFAPARYHAAQRILILAATYGDGVAPASAKDFLDRLAQIPSAPDVSLAVLGFGDRGFPKFCAFARDVADAASAKGWTQLIPTEYVDRQSPQDFARWGRALGAALGAELELIHRPVLSAAQQLTLISRRDYGAEVQAPSAILRFALPRRNLWQWLLRRDHYQAGDLLGVLPEGSDLPRFYSLASARRDGFIEIAVRRQPAGLCSGQLTALQPGGSIRAFIRRNPDFHAAPGRAPLLLIGAGCGIAPLAGMIRANESRRSLHLFYGLRDRTSDFLYDEELAEWQRDGRMTGLTTATSRGARPHHVQDALRAEAAEILCLIRSGARIMVCGGRDMATGVADALAEILIPAGLTPALLKAEGRYVEDVF